MLVSFLNRKCSAVVSRLTVWRRYFCCSEVQQFSSNKGNVLQKIQPTLRSQQNTLDFLIILNSMCSPEMTLCQGLRYRGRGVDNIAEKCRFLQGYNTLVRNFRFECFCYLFYSPKDIVVLRRMMRLLNFGGSGI